MSNQRLNFGRIGTERQAAFTNVRTGQVQLIGVDDSILVQAGRELSIVRGHTASQTGDYYGIQIAQQWDDILFKLVQAGVS